MTNRPDFAEGSQRPDRGDYDYDPDYDFEAVPLPDVGRDSSATGGVRPDPGRTRDPAAVERQAADPSGALPESRAEEQRAREG